MTIMSNAYAGFLSPLLIEEIPGDDCNWILREPCIYHLNSLRLIDGIERDEWVEAPAGFITNFGSIPKTLQWIPGLSSNGKFRRAYAIHDKLYRAPVVRTSIGARAITRDEADNILDEALGVLGASNETRGIIRYFIKRFGGKHWDRYRKEERSL